MIRKAMPDDDDIAEWKMSFQMSKRNMKGTRKKDHN